MVYTSSSLIARARSLADLPNTTFISYDDEVNSLNEAYRQGYTKLTENNDDYYVSTANIVLDAGTLTLNNIYSADLPEDMFTVRLVSYNDQGHWRNMAKFSLSQFNGDFSQPMYRIQGGKILVKQSPNMFLPNIQIQYYPKPEALTKPKPFLSYIPTTLDTSVILHPTSYTANAGTIDETDYLFYVQAKAIKVASVKLGSDVTLKAAGSPTIGRLAYFGGFLYWLQDTSVYKATTDFESLGTPVLVSGADVVSSMCLSGTVLMYNAGTAVKALDLVTGAVNTSTGVTAGATEWITPDYGTTFRWIEAGLINGTIFAADYLYLWGEKILFVKGFNLFELVDDATATLIRPDIYRPTGSGEISAGYLGTAGKYPVSAVGVDSDTVLDYPVNMFWEYISLLAAIDFKIKQNADPSSLMVKFGALEKTLDDSLDRDEFTVARINNYYGTDWNLR
jgi:hypothetical protein